MKVIILFMYPMCVELLLYAQHFAWFQRDSGDNTSFLCPWQDNHLANNHKGNQVITLKCLHERCQEKTLPGRNNCKFTVKSGFPDSVTHPLKFTGGPGIIKQVKRKGHQGGWVSCLRAREQYLQRSQGRKEHRWGFPWGD